MNDSDKNNNSQDNDKVDFSRISVVLPAYNEAASIGELVEQTLKVTNNQAEIIVVDDGSTDQTADIAKAAGAIVVKHPYNKGNGASVKTGARSASRDIVVFMDSDGQHDPSDIAALAAMIDKYDLVIGSRSFNKMEYLHRNLANKFYSRLAAYLTEQNIPDLTSGFRAFKRQYLLAFLHLFPNRFSYPTTSTLSFIKAGLNVGFCPINSRKRVSQSKVKIFRDGFKFFLIILKIIVLFHPFRIFFPVSILSFILGLISGILSIKAEGRLHIPNSATILFVASVFIFLMGLVSEQIASLKMEFLDKRDNDNSR
ncbi:MAG: glycosyltransferase family 2 protein [candidate division Zixibacteria bacterium]|nr:glycosyltransferase family 2 protein [candidate division Zixibacteria bacterium]